MKQNNYDKFIRSGLNAGFTDDQINWLEEWLWAGDKEEPEIQKVREDETKRIIKMLEQIRESKTR